MIDWKIKKFTELTTQELYELLQLRAEVFIVEQNCVYQDVDGRDLSAWQVLGYQGEQLVACSRVLLLENGNASFGRIAVKQTLRKEGLGKELVAKTMVFIAEQDDFKNKTLQISAQEYLVRFYQGFGFQQQGDSYLEDGIPHVCMTI